MVDGLVGRLPSWYHQSKKTSRESRKWESPDGSAEWEKKKGGGCGDRNTKIEPAEMSR